MHFLQQKVYISAVNLNLLHFVQLVSVISPPKGLFSGIYCTECSRYFFRLMWDQSVAECAADSLLRLTGGTFCC
ncbi:hypothetical protein PGRAT_09240 [Paenibacillus graminis]|uniref:Uncharacterized protein n=1 Tax=Paenibacillus graminis TaxID=189425 RepID=A0A089M201_9BACL|nr:hypothetical protein PGRAT_09240 [Paenibacillus graminis]